jgi:hypothetical protein
MEPTFFIVCHRPPHLIEDKEQGSPFDVVDAFFPSINKAREYIEIHIPTNCRPAYIAAVVEERG